jgi:hypothetical protein
VSAKRWIQINGTRYLIRGPYTVAEVRKRYSDFLAKYPGCGLTLAQWACQRGAVYFGVKNQCPTSTHPTRRPATLTRCRQ